MQKAILVGIQLPKISDQELQSSLQELSRLVHTLGYEVVGQLTQKRSSDRGGTIIGEGKLKELAKWTGGRGVVKSLAVHKKSRYQLKTEAEKREAKAQAEKAEEDAKALAASSETPEETVEVEVEEPEVAEEAQLTEEADIVIFDCDLTPSQLRNLESATGVQVLDRTGVIIEIFSRHAKTRAARLQVEIAKLSYVAPRLRETGGGEGRQGGGTSGRGGGESALELDKRKIRDRIKELKNELASIGVEDLTRRSRRQEEISVALVGYTNAGKSSLMRAMTGSEVLIADKLFATLDTTIRPMHPESRPKILISDTVGFIKKLPHDLVASFKSTLDEALNASLLLFVVDAADPQLRSQLQVTKTVLAEVGAVDIPNLLVLNKQDKLSDDEKSKLKEEFPDAFFLSTRSPEDLKSLREKILSYFEEDMIDEDIFVPYHAKGIIGEIRAQMRVLAEKYDENGVQLKVRASEDKLKRIKGRITSAIRNS
jgi:GTP-binding protein HflX